VDPGRYPVTTFTLEAPAGTSRKVNVRTQYSCPSARIAGLLVGVRLNSSSPHVLAHPTCLGAPYQRITRACRLNSSEFRGLVHFTLAHSGNDRLGRWLTNSQGQRHMLRLPSSMGRSTPHCDCGTTPLKLHTTWSTPATTHEWRQLWLAGPIEIVAECADGKCTAVTFKNTPSFVGKLIRTPSCATNTIYSKTSSQLRLYVEQCRCGCVLLQAVPCCHILHCVGAYRTVLTYAVRC
jgi:hypothetical protein